MAYVAAIGLATVGVGLSVVGMVVTATYVLGGVLFRALAVAADVLTLTIPSVIGALRRRRSPTVLLAGLLWCAGAAVTVANLAGYVGEHIEQYQAGRGHRADGTTLTGRLPRWPQFRSAMHLVRGTFNSCRNDWIEEHSSYGRVARRTFTPGLSQNRT
jgi:hypothetical protein